ncbi:hypothetical protein ACFO5K_03170 [Nocardia halotolerans]|uniref:Uncharacterized protein n=1 Tax=Nocardia halotolerans TaxID=1755878 RepID=A0ABV8VB28_9NOCA
MITSVDILTAPLALMVVLLPAHLLALVVVFACVNWCVRGLLWPPRSWCLMACALLIPIVLQIVEVSGAANHGYDQWGATWPCLVWLVAAAVAGAFAWSAFMRIFDVRLIFLAESGDDVLLARQIVGDERGMDPANPKWSGNVVVDVLLRGGDLVVHATVRGGRGASRRVVERPLRRIELRYVTRVVEHRFSAGKSMVTWYALPTGRTLEAATAGTVVVTTSLSGLAFTIPTDRPELIAEAIRRRLRGSAGIDGPHR